MDRVARSCDFCGSVQRNANHWWAIKIDLEHRTYLVMPAPADSGEIQFHLCGEECLNKVESLVRAGKQPFPNIAARG